MKERPILFSGEMVRAILAGTKTQTRRLLVPQPAPFVQQTADRHTPKHPEPYLDSYCGEPKTAENPRGMSVNWCWWTRDDRCGAVVARCRYGVPGDRLWVRETHSYIVGAGKRTVYAADGPPTDRFSSARIEGIRWTPSIHMPRAVSRITLEVTDVRVQRLQEITEEDARAEGVTPLEHVGPDQQILDGVPGRTHGTHPHVLAYACLWDSINHDRALWDSNPWIWAVSFRRLS